MMKSFKTILLAATLAAAPAGLFAQVSNTPVPVPAVTGEATPAAASYAAPQAAPAVAATYNHIAPTAALGQPVEGGYTIQSQVTEIGKDALWMHDVVLMPIITIICILVLALLVWVVLRYRAAANPVPSRTSHNTAIEVIWTIVPVLVLLIIAVPSIKLLARQYSPPKADLTIKVIGNQWYWTYQYPDNGDFELVSNMLKEPADVTGKERARTDADGPRNLAVDERLVIPAGRTVKFIVTSADVIHSFAVPAFWTKMDAVPGRLNETWVNVPADKTGVYFGQCSELCGARHAYMPIAVEVVTPAQFAAWVHAKGGKMPGEGAQATSGDETKAASPATAPAATPEAPLAVGAPGAPVSDKTVDATAKPVTSSQGEMQNTGR
jgi:cytochrome c oxidase subunit 2